MLTTEVHWQNPLAGTVSAYIDIETGQLLRQLGEPNPGYVFKWCNILKALEVKKEEIELYNGSFLDNIPESQRLLAFSIRQLRVKGEKYEQIAQSVHCSRATVGKLLKKMGMTKSRD